MKISRIRHKLLLTIAFALSLGFVGTTYFYSRAVGDSIVLEYQRTLHRLTDSVVLGIETIMTENHADIMPEYAKRLKAMPGLIDFSVIRNDGNEAYVDNGTIRSVNKRLGEAVFAERQNVLPAKQLIDPSSAAFAAALLGGEAVSYVENDANDQKIVYFFDAIPKRESCERCHGSSEVVRGVIRVTASMAEIDRDLARARLESLIILALSLVSTMTITGIMLGRSVAQPIESMTKAMALIARGNFDMSVTSARQDEVGKMANIFNLMAKGIRDTHGNMIREREKLNLLIEGAGEAVVVTNAEGSIVLVNAAATQLLGKTAEQIRNEGINGLLDDTDTMQRLLESEERLGPVALNYKDRRLLLSASTIYDESGEAIGSAALLRDISAEYRLLKELERLSTTDALTDVFNRRHLDNQLRQELERSRDTGIPLSLIMFDADHFKNFNDTYGHDQGDRVLKTMGSQMKLAIRKYDIPCRYGGEEFMIILPSTDAEGALTVAERLRTDIASMKVDGLSVTISLGIATYPVVAAKAPEDMILAADAALYKSKEGGRNMTTVFVPSPEIET